MKTRAHNAAIASAARKLLIIIPILLISFQLPAQSFFGTIVGTVTDSSGAVVPSASVKVTNVGTDTSQNVQSEASGRFSVLNLVPGTYKVEVSKATFKRFVRDNAVVEVGQTTRVDAALTVGAVSETVEVSTNAPLLQTDSSSLSQEIEGQQVQEEPLNGRNVMNLIALAPGVVPTGGALGGTGLDQGTRTAGGQGFGNYEIGGAIQGQSGNYIDGVANILLGSNSLALVPTQDAIQEFNVASSNAGAEFGRYSGGVVSMTTRSGSNAWHGSVWEYNRNRDYNANDFFSNQTAYPATGTPFTPRGVWNQNQYGASASGPIKKDKVFFSFTFEKLNLLTYYTSNTFVPTVAEQNGVFNNGDKAISADPLGICTVAAYTGQTLSNGLSFASGGTYISNLYVPNGGGVAGTTCGDPSLRVMKQFYPVPNATTLPAANFYLETNEGNVQSQYTGRVDAVLSQRQRLFARYSFWAPTDIAHNEFNDTGYKNDTNGTGSNTTTWPTHDGKSTYNTTQGVIGDTVTLSPNTVLDVRADYIRQYDPNLAESLSVNEAQFDGNSGNGYFASIAPTENVHIMPAFNTGGGNHGYYNMGNFPNDGINWINTYGLAFSLTKIVGPHTIKAGGEFRLMDNSSVSYNGGGSGSFSFGNGGFMKDEWANFLAGYTSTGTFKSALRVADVATYAGYYVTDTWQAGRNLTINAGLRYELPGADAEKNNRATVLLPHTVDPLTNITGTLSMVSSSLYGARTMLTPYHDLFAPNIGFAYRATSSTVIRGGYGISYLPMDISGGWKASGASINGAQNNWSHLNSGNPVAFQSDLKNVAGSGGVPASPGRYATAGTSPTLFLSGPPTTATVPISYIPGLPATVSTTEYLGKGITGAVSNQPGFPFTQHWNAALSHEFKGNMMVEVSYSGLKGINMPESGNHQLNTIPDSILTSQPFASYAGNAATTANLTAAAAGGYSGCQNNPVQAPGLLAAQNAGTNILSTFTIGQCSRPYPFYSGVSDSLGYFTIENYHAFATRFEKRMGAAGVISANYTWSQNHGNTDTQASFVENKSTVQGGSTNSGIQDWNRMDLEYSLISFDVTNRAIVSYVTNLPFGKGNRYINSLNGAANTLVSGWTLNGITTFQSGFPVALSNGSGSFQLGNYGAGSGRPMIVPGCNPKIGGSGLSREKSGAWFNTSCFASIGQATLSNGTPSPFVTAAGLNSFYDGWQYGNEPRVDPTLRADGIKNFDAAIGKATAIHEKLNLAFRAEFFNIFNRVQFSPPGNSVNGSGYGAVGYQVNHPRQMQLSLRLNY